MEGNGVINVLKPAGMTSHDCVYFVRKITGIKRVGHTGTLDPMAAGVLPVCIGKATRIMDYLDADKKSYRCEMILGLTTETWDIWGTVTEDKRTGIKMPEPHLVRDAFSSFKGMTYQIPPGYSSIRVDGKRLYEYARQGIKIDVEKRPIIIYSLDLLDYNVSTGRITFDLVCSKGTYVRSICHEVGKILGCGGAMSFLLRTGSGAFNLEDGAILEDLSKSYKEHLLPIDYPLQGLGKLSIERQRAAWFCNGGYLRPGEVELLKYPDIKDMNRHIKLRDGLENSYCVYSDDRFLGVTIYKEKEKIYKADKVMGE